MPMDFIRVSYPQVALFYPQILVIFGGFKYFLLLFLF